MSAEPIGAIQYRPAVVELDTLATRAAGDDRIPVSLSSENPVNMGFGREILVHSREAIDFSRLVGDTLPFFDSHDPTRQIGVIENVRLSGDRRLRGMLRKGNHPDAAWMFRDISQGLRPNLSLGYIVDEHVRDGDTLRAIRWTPVEGSSVGVPADVTVGVGRSADLSNTRSTKMSGTYNLQDVNDIHALAHEHGMSNEARGWIERGLTRDQVSAEILSRKRANAPSPVDVPGNLDLSVRDARAYTVGFGRALVDVADRRAITGVVGEVSNQIALRLNRPTSGIFIPLDLATRASVTGNVVGTSSLGGAGVQTSVLSLIDILRNKMLVRQLGATVLSGLTGNISFPRQITPNTMAWEGENPSTAHAHTAATLDNVNLSPKTAMASSTYSRQFLVQGSFDAGQFVQTDLATVLAVGLDLAAMDGTGSNNQPTGIMRATGVNTIVHGASDGAVPTWPDMVSYETQVSTYNGDVGSMGWITTPGMRGKLKTTLKSTTAGSTYIWETDNTINGYPAFATSNMPSNYTRGTSTTAAHGAVFGVWSQVLIAEWGGLVELIVDPFTYASQAMVATTAIMMVDVGVRQPKALAVSKSALIA